jgi:hypothetical protein
MKNLIALSFFLVLFVSTNAQAPVLKWEKLFTGNGNSSDSASLIKLYTLDNSIYIAGTSDAYGNGNDIVLIKRDYITGDTIWTRHYNGPANSDDQAVDMEINQTTGDVYITGKSLGLGTAYDIVTIKYSSSGVLGWANRWNNVSRNGDDIPVDIGIDSSGKIYVTGYTFNGNTAFLDTKEDLLVMVYNSTGSLIGSTINDIHYRERLPDWVKGAVVNLNGDIFFAGETLKGTYTNGLSTIFVGGIKSNLSSYYSPGIGDDYSQIKVVTIRQPETIYSPDDFNFFNAMDLDNSNNVYVASLMDTLIRAGSSYKMVFTKISSSGNILWQKKLEGNNNHKNLRVNALKLDPNNLNVYATGYEMNTSGNFDWFILKYNSSGTLQWKVNKNGNGNGNDMAYSIAFDSQQNPIIAGHTRNSSGNDDITFAKFDRSTGEEIYSVSYDSGNKSQKALNVLVDANKNIIINGIQKNDPSNFDILTLRYCDPPVAAGTISGLITVCQGQNQVTYSVPTIANATSYLWTLPNGATGTSATNSITVNYGTSSVSGNITVKGHNDCGDGASSTLPITVNPLPSNAGVISGTATVCQGQNSVIYSVPTIENATSYAWTLPTGATGTSATNSITVNYATSAISGNITVKGHNTCGDGTVSILAITVDPLPASAGTITGNSTVCQGQNSVTYTVPAIANATSYIWSLPSDATGTSFTNSIVVDYGVSAVSGNISVKGHNDCGEGTSSSLAITVNPYPAAAGLISGHTTLCQGQNQVTYSVPTIANATSYLWTLPAGATGTSATNSITVNYGTSSVSGNITVKGHNDCGDGASSTLPITVNPLPSNAGIISGTATVCQGQNSVTYTVPTIENATSYAWTLPTGATGTSATNSITVNYATSAISGNITVKGHNTCGDGTVSILAITVDPLPASAGTITGNSTVCQGQNSVTYTVPAIANATSYIWTLSDGATGTSNTNSIKVDFGMTAVSGGIEVFGRNSCGDGNASILAINVNPHPVDAGEISGPTNVCQGQNSITYSISRLENASSYIWTLPSGVTGTSNSNSITVNFGTAAISGEISVKGRFICGDGSSSSIMVTVNPLPANAGIISGTTSICQGQNAVTYAVPTIANTTSYIWTLPEGATGESTTKTIVVNYGNSSKSGNITVQGSNDCGNGVISTLSVTVNVKPETPIITLTENGLHSTAINGNQWYDQVGLINGAINQYFLPVSRGEYYVIVSLNGCNSDMSNSILFIPTGFDKIGSAPKMKVYPNPVVDELIIEIIGNLKKTNFEIINSIGQIIYKGSIVEKAIVQTSNFKPGVYIIKLESGDNFEFERIIKR